MPFIIASAFSISTLVKGPWTAPMQRAVALRSYFQSLRVRAVVVSLLSSLLEGAPKPRLPAYEDSALCRAFDTTFSEEELQGVAVPDPADIERLRQICQRGGERLWLEHSAPPCAPAPSPPPPYPPCAQVSRATRCGVSWRRSSDSRGVLSRRLQVPSSAAGCW